MWTDATSTYQADEWPDVNAFRRTVAAQQRDADRRPGPRSDDVTDAEDRDALTSAQAELVALQDEDTERYGACRVCGDPCTPEHVHPEFFDPNGRGDGY